MSESARGAGWRLVLLGLLVVQGPGAVRGGWINDGTPLVEVVNVASGGGATYGSAVAQTNSEFRFVNGLLMEAKPRWFPEFMIPLGDCCHEWTDFELKASTNNFSGWEGPDMVYFYISSLTNRYCDDRWARYYFTDSGAADVREWVKGTANVSIASQLVDANSAVRQVIFYPSTNTLTIVGGVAVTNDARVWQYEGNTNLIWSFVRYDGVDYERDAAGRQIWTPIVPVQWKVERKDRFDGGD